MYGGVLLAMPLPFLRKRHTKRTKTTWDIRKTTWDVGKIMSDVIQITSDLFLAVCNALKSKRLQALLISRSASVYQRVTFSGFCLVIPYPKGFLPCPHLQSAARNQEPSDWLCFYAVRQHRFSQTIPPFGNRRPH